MNQSKQNSVRGVFQSKQRRSMKNLYESSNLYSTTQTLFPSNKNSIRQNQIESTQFNKADLYKTLGNSSSWGGWVRPESKQACRKVIARPQTSKGFRRQASNKVLFLNLQNERFIQSKAKPVLNSKRKSNRMQQQNYGTKKNVDYEQSGQIEIVINKRPQDVLKKGPSVHKNKFQTDLDDQFLQLFAD